MLENKDRLALRKILMIIGEMRETIAKLGGSFSSFQEDRDLQNSISFQWLQIGHTIRWELTDRFKETHGDLNWRSYVALRNEIAHDYYQIDVQALWQTTKSQLDELEEKCHYILSKN